MFMSNSLEVNMSCVLLIPTYIFNCIRCMFPDFVSPCCWSSSQASVSFVILLIFVSIYLTVWHDKLYITLVVSVNIRLHLMSNWRNTDNVISRLYLVYLVIYCEYQTVTEVKQKDHRQYNKNDTRYSCDQCVKSISKFNFATRGPAEIPIGRPLWVL